MGDRIIFDPSDRPDLQNVAQVIDLAEVRISRGWSKGKTCQHLSLVYSAQERRIECKHCDQPVDGFDAFMVLCRRFDDMERAAQARERRTKEGLAAVIIRRAAKAIDKAWGRKMAPVCQCCGRGILPEDFADRHGAVSIELERARRAKKPAALSPETDQ